MEGLDYLGAGEGLATQTILVRVEKIDTAKLRAAVAKDSAWWAVLEPALALADWQPQLAVDTGLPIAKQQLERIGITADLAVAKMPPSARSSSETRRLLGLGAALGFALTFGGAAVYYRLTRR